MSDASSGILRQIARWVRQLYPPDRAGDPARGARWWGSLQPDLLAEQHVITVLADAPDLAEASLRDLTPDQAAEALTLLARVSGRHPAAAEILGRALRADLSGLGVPAVQVAAQTGGGLGRVLADVLGDARAALKTLIQVQEAIPYPTAALAEANAVVTGRINQKLPADTTQPETARWSDELGSALRQAGHLARAVPPAKEAVRIYRQLAAADPGTYRPDLAKALNNLGLWYFELDRPEEALPASREAADIYSELAAAIPARYGRRLVHALTCLDAWYTEQGRYAEAATAREEAQGCRENIPKSAEDRRTPPPSRPHGSRPRSP